MDVYFQLTAIILTVSIVAVPLWYPRFSRFRRDADAGIDHLRESLTITVEDDDTGTVRVSTLEAGDRGFAELTAAIGSQTTLADDPTGIELVFTELDTEYDTLVIGGGDVSTGDEATLRVTYDDERATTVLDSADSSLERVLDLTDLSAWLDAHTHARSHYATTTLVVLWGTALVLAIL
ncbi:hypothetical protein [Natronobiforma cellulositropha]|uniref:hypothetical protein n=1 Tax=Natronobiforma cellulositropha TaxID=1679076 RepID=UPI0021D587D6|nr:hypothetical protein [Natronobiforma cellulositropha]